MTKNQTINDTIVKLIYLIPSDKTFNPKYKEALVWALNCVQEWYKFKLEDHTFQIFSENPIVTILNNNSSYFTIENQNEVDRDYSYKRVMEICSSIFHSKYSDERFTTIAYLDGGLYGGGWNGFCFLPEKDLQEITNEMERNTPGLYVGGLAHELGHALDLDDIKNYELDYDEKKYLMWDFSNYPNLELTNNDIIRLKPQFSTPIVTPAIQPTPHVSKTNKWSFVFPT